MIRKFLYIIAVIFLMACAHNRIDLSNYREKDFCSAIFPDSSITLSQQWDSVIDSMPNKTGVYVLDQGTESMVTRAWMMEKAEKSLDIQYFIFSADNIGLIACDYIIRAANRGVKVRILVDDIMVQADAFHLLTLNSHENLNIKIYNPSINLGKNLPRKIFNLTTDFRGVNQRMHNKAFIVDNKLVVTGGRNVADEYFDYDHKYNFRDRDVFLLGGITSEIKKSFDDFWNDPLSVRVSELVETSDKNLKDPKRFEPLHQYACDSINFLNKVREKIAAVPEFFKAIQESGHLRWVDSVTYISDAPGKNDHTDDISGGGISTSALIKLIKEAKKSINIQTPYLVMTKLGQNLFREAINRGVEVTILTNSLASTDNLDAFSGYQRDREKLLSYGINLYEFRPDAAVRLHMNRDTLDAKLERAPIFSLHAKSMVIDEQIAVIGTFNLDPRSANLNTECVTVIYSEKIASELTMVMEEDLKPDNAWEISKDFNPDKKAGFLTRIRVWYRGFLLPKKIL